MLKVRVDTRSDSAKAEQQVCRRQKLIWLRYSVPIRVRPLVTLAAEPVSIHRLSDFCSLDAVEPAIARANNRAALAGYIESPADARRHIVPHHDVWFCRECTPAKQTREHPGSRTGPS